jgi:UDPglucose 6-dehydrogenase
LQGEKVGIVGLGLGFSFAHYLSHLGHTVVGVDIDPRVIKNPRVDAEMKQWLKKHRSSPRFGTDFGLLKKCDYIFIFVSSPLVRGRLSIKNVLAALRSGTKVNARAEYCVLSTLPIGGMATIHERFPALRVSYTPPMIRKHMFQSTFYSPPSGWQLFGGRASGRLRAIFRGAQAPTTRQFRTTEDVAEAAKLCTNLMLATKIIIANAIGSWLGPSRGKSVCEVVVADPRVGDGYFTPGGPASGPCLPRDLTEIQAVSDGGLKELVTVLNRLNGTANLLELA